MGWGHTLYVIIAFLNTVLEFLTHWCIWTTTQPRLQKLVMTTRSTEPAENGLWDKFSLPPIWLHHANIHCTYIFCDLIGDLKSEIGLALCDKKCCSEHQTLFACAEGLGRRLYLITYDMQIQGGRPGRLGSSAVMSGRQRVDTQGVVPDSNNARFMSKRPWHHELWMVLMLSC